MTGLSFSSHSSSSFIFISDTHVGNNFGICTPNPELGDTLKDTSYYEANDLQTKLYEGFQKCVHRIKQPNRIRALFLGGDLVDGTNPKRPGVDLWTNDPLVAVYDFNKLIWPIASKATEVFGIRGSDYHVNPDRTTINYDELACQMIGATQYKNPIHQVNRKALADRVKELRAQGKKRNDIALEDLYNDIKKQSKNNKLTKKLQRDDNLFKKELQSIRTQARQAVSKESIPYPVSDVRFKGIFNNTAIVLKHYVSFSPNYMYRGTGLTRNDFIQTAQKQKHFPNGYTSIIYAYGHVHYYHYTGNEVHHNFTIPCWKANDTYLRANGITEPDFGIVEVIVEPNDEVIVLPYTLRGDEYPVTEPYDLSGPVRGRILA